MRRLRRVAPDSRQPAERVMFSTSDYRDSSFARSFNEWHVLAIIQTIFASITAVANGQLVDTSMGLTPSGGVIMSTRCGDFDPGVLEFVAREHNYNAEALGVLVDRQSGMLGVSGVSGDMRMRRALAPSNSDAALAIAMFCHSIKKQIAGMVAVLGGIDAPVFTGGIGENDGATRHSICERLDGMGIIVAPSILHVMPVQEHEQIALNSWRLTYET